MNRIRKARELRDEGFTLIELLIVIVVLAILAAAVIFGLSGITGDSAKASCNSDAKSTEVAVELLVTLLSLACPATTANACSEVLKVRFPKASVVSLRTG